MATRRPQDTRPMSYRERQRQQRRRTNLYIVIGVVLIILVVIGGFVLLNVNSNTNTGTVTLPSVTVGADNRTGNLAFNERGNANAKVTLTEYGDFQCPNCGNFTRTTGNDILRDYADAGKIKFQFVVFPFLDKNAGKPEGESFHAAMAAECAGDQNRYWDYYETLFQNQNGENEGAFSDDHLKAFAKTLGLNTDTFNSCLDNRKYANAVGASYQTALSKGVNSTPSFDINGQRVTLKSSYDELKTDLDQAIAAAK